MIIVTGGAGFIGSSLIWRLNAEGHDDIVVVDNFGAEGKWQNLGKRRFYDGLHKDELAGWLATTKEKPRVVFHLGACSSTSEMNFNYLLANNVHYSQMLWNYCRDKGIPFIYASSAATYGAGEQGYDDDPKGADALRPINPYGFSKKVFDSWVLRQHEAPPFWAGLKFFNVFGPGEYHKGSMRSLVCKALPDIVRTGQVSLFKSYKEGVAHGEQQRDFVYVKDVVDVMMHLWQSSQAPAGRRAQSGLYNVGTGKARSFADLARAVFLAIDRPAVINWVEMPDVLRPGYQYFTEARLERLRSLGGYEKPFRDLEAAVADYVCNYLLEGCDPYL